MKRKNLEGLVVKNDEESADFNDKYFANGYPEPEKFLAVLEKNNPELAETYQAVLGISEQIRSEGGLALLVGGSVRDYYCDLVPKDYDLEVYRIEPDKLRDILENFGKVDEVGMSFGILKVTIANGQVLDISLPRSESKVAQGHKGFSVLSDPSMDPQVAAKRRDFTINSVMANPLTGEVYDYFGGLRDLKNGVLRVTDAETFKDDPLRVLRGAQFSARLNLVVDPDSFKVMESIVPELGELSKSRFLEEWDKLLIKGFRPSAGLRLLKDLGVLKKWHPELEALVGLPQESKWHPEGDVWNHTLMVVDEASEHLNDFDLDSDQKRVVMLTTLCHDLGKVTATKYIEAENRITSIGHESAGVEPAGKFLESIGLDPRNIEFKKILKLVAEHMAPSLLYAGRFESNQKIKATMDGVIRRLAKRIHPATIKELVAVATADNLGRGPFEDSDGQTLLNLYTAGQWIIEEAQKLKVDKRLPERALKGEDLLILGFKQGKNIGEIMTLADDLRDSKGLGKMDILSEIIMLKPEGIKNVEDERAVLEKLREMI